MDREEKIAALRRLKEMAGRGELRPTKRGAMTPARRKRIWDRDHGRCGECNDPVELSGTTVDHRIPLFQGGSDDDENLRFLCAGCDSEKTYLSDAPANAKIRRLIKKERGERGKGPRLQGRGFDKSRTRGFDGKVRPRKPKRTAK